MKTLRYIMLSLAAVLTIAGCQKDPLDIVNEGAWNNERNILGITFTDQVGLTTITRNSDSATVSFTYNTSASADLSAIEISSLEVSYGATASVAAGETLNFENADKTASITVTSAKGETLEWTITLEPFTEVLIGDWNVSSLLVYGGTGPEWGGAAVIKMTDKSWCWDAGTGPAAEEDNIFTFEFTGFDEDGNTTGDFYNNPGNDGKYADFIFIFSDPDIDLNDKYRKIPAGSGTWVHDQTNGTVIFTFEDNSTVTATFNEAGTYSLYNDGSTVINKIVADHSFSFPLTGTDDWTNIYTDYDKFVARPRSFWVDITKVK